MIPTAQETFRDADFLAFANEEVNLGLLPSIMRLHEDYLLYTEEMPLVANTSRYEISHRAIGNKFRELSYKDSNGNIFEMTRINIEDLPDYNGSAISNRYYAYYIENNEIVLVPGVSSSVSGSLMLSYYLRPNELVTDNSAGKITAINTTTGEITVDAVPSAFSISLTFDLIKSKSPFRTVALELSVTSINPVTKVIAFDPADLPSNLQVDDYVCIAEQTIIPQIPAELHVVLAHRVASRCMEALGDAQGLQIANQKLAEFELNTTTIIDNRAEGSPRKVVARHSHLRQGMFRRRYRMK
jgi:hypothetical protein